MNLYIISQTENNGYDTYDSAVVAAESAEEACKINPAGHWTSDMWASGASRVHYRLIGKAEADVERGVVLASFNAG